MPEDLELRVAWYLSGWDKGISSMTIVAGIMRRPIILRSGSGVPHDEADVGRCVRLLECFPEWRARLSEVASSWPSWAPWAARWDEVEAAYQQALAGQATQFNSLCDELNG